MGLFWNKTKKSVIDNLGLDLKILPDDTFIINKCDTEENRTVYYRYDRNNKFFGVFPELTIYDFKAPGKNYVFNCDIGEFEKYDVPKFIEKIVSIYGKDDSGEGLFVRNDMIQIDEGFWLGRTWQAEKHPDPCIVFYNDEDGLSFTIWTLN